LEKLNSEPTMLLAFLTGCLLGMRDAGLWDFGLILIGGVYFWYPANLLLMGGKEYFEGGGRIDNELIWSERAGRVDNRNLFDLMSLIVLFGFGFILYGWSVALLFCLWLAIMVGYWILKFKKNGLAESLVLGLVYLIPGLIGYFRFLGDWDFDLILLIGVWVWLVVLNQLKVRGLIYLPWVNFLVLVAVWFWKFK